MNCELSPLLLLSSPATTPKPPVLSPSQMSPEFPVDDLDLSPELDLEICPPPGTSSSGSGSHFEFSCTPDVADALCDVGLTVSDWLDSSLICS